MNYKNYKAALLLLLFFGLTNLAAADESREFVKEINKNFQLNADGRVELSNQYGRINIRPWSRNEVKIDVRIVVQARDEDDANKVFERININFYDTNNLVKASTELSSSNSGSSWWSWLMNGNNKSTEFKIYYEVQMPQRAFLMTEAKYCDVNSGDLDGETEFVIKYGDLSLGNLNNATKMKISYGEADVENISGKAWVELAYSEFEADVTGELDMKARYSEIKVEKAADVELDSRYTEVDFGPVEDIEIEAGYGDVEIESARSVRANSNYTGYEIGAVSEMADIDTDYGSVEIGPLAAGFSKVRLRGGYSSMSIAVDSKAGYSLEASTSYAGIDVPSSMEVSLSDKSGNSRTVKGKKSGTGQGVISVSSRYGNIDIKEY